MQSRSLTKADTLLYLQDRIRLSEIDPFLVFRYSKWQSDPDRIVAKITSSFTNERTLIIRSSTTDEKSSSRFTAGYYHTESGIPSEDRFALSRGINKVVNSFSKGARTPDPNDQFIVQLQVEDVEISGVVVTFDQRLESPYYVINYDDFNDRTDVVTGGSLSQALRLVPWWQDIAELSPLWHSLVLSVQEIESLFPESILNIEFCIDKKEAVHIFQVRTVGSKPGETNNTVNFKDIILQLKRNLGLRLYEDAGLLGTYTVYADMSDWNPAEMIGSRPNPLDYSLYDFLITSGAWNQARATIGYTDVSPHGLMTLIGDKPYIDARVSFNSLTPSTIPQNLREKLIEYYLEKLSSHAHLQDKVEFEIVWSCYDFSFDENSAEAQAWGLTETEVAQLGQDLLQFTNLLLVESSRLLAEDLRRIHKLKSIIGNYPEVEGDASVLLNQASALLRNCRDLGTIPFARLARLAFVGLSMLRSLENQKIISTSFSEEFLASITTIATQMAHDWNELAEGNIDSAAFSRKYGHLRPGTYNIISPRYDSVHGLFDNLVKQNTASAKPSRFVQDRRTARRIDMVLEKKKFDYTALALLEFIQSAIVGREYAKYEFTKSLSNALELIAMAGQHLGFSRKDLAMIDLNTLMANPAPEHTTTEYFTNVWKQSIRNNRSSREPYRRIAFPPVISHANDLVIVPYYASYPNFVTRKRVEGFVEHLHAAGDFSTSLEDKMVILESADPGYDWIFAQGIRGLITQYGGAASHMAIRCAEFRLPAAIGCGEIIFSRLRDARQVLLDCSSEIIVPLY